MSTKEYRQKPEVKEKNKLRMRDVYNTKDGQDYEHLKRRTPQNRYAHGKVNARKRNKEFTLTLEEYEILIKRPCNYCNKSIADETGVGLDRIDNDKGYIPGNVEPCCSKCNRIRKNSMKSDVFKKQTELNKRRVE